ncbi:hypothetical protein GWR56_02535 [Mucilaginibacter sp. 14171R-50]|uniref:hypothetical protein n=1 Tax=Mucilaginibacter sp. 14171R-50 TaxID=2703789 RepID=UPI00138DCF53|nr:hypothetical protein [Mucilaginibacter sp. 14171R-50]QHS54472.1 hypothetical protein GWR56_02535 [Mucilaginibacter sp. 14171R-50]
MKKYLLVLFPAILLLVSSCKKDPIDFTGYEANGNSETDKFANSYMPTSKGTSWTYVSDPGNGVKTNSEIHMTGVITPLDGVNYFEVKSTTTGRAEETAYYYVDDHNYKIKGATIESGTVVEFHYLDASLPADGEWTAKMSPNGYINGVPARTKGKIIEKDVTKVVLGKTYKNVVHTQIIIQYDLGAGFEDFGTYDYYLAKGVGLVETDTNFFGLVATSKLLSYSIK